MSRRRVSAVLLAASMLAASGNARAPANTGVTVRISQAKSEPNGPTPATSVPDTTSPSMSLDGTWVTFSSDASNLVPGDTNGVADVFARNLFTSKIVRVSVSSSEKQANGPSYSPAPSGYGDKIAFVSQATNLASGDTNTAADVFLRDMSSGKTSRISVSSSESQADGESRTPFVSLFGRYVTFESAATNLASGDTNTLPDAFIRDRTSGKTARIAAPPVTDENPVTPKTWPVGEPQWPDQSPVEQPGALPKRLLPPPPQVYQPHPVSSMWTMRPTVSYDGRYVAFVRGVTRDAPANPWMPQASSLDSYIYDRTAKKYKQIVIPRFESRWRQMTANPMISADGRSVVLEYWSIMDEESGGSRHPLDPKDILRYDVPANAIQTVSIDTWGWSGDADSYAPWTTTKGEAIVFASDATNLVAGDTNGVADVFVYDARSRTTSRMSVGSGAREANGASLHPTTDYAARWVAYGSEASNVTSGDTDGVRDVFLHQRGIGVANGKPNLRPVTGTRMISTGDTVTVQLRATDPDHDPIRYGIHPTDQGVPPGATVNPTTGRFSWTPSPEQAGEWTLAFWVDDPRGASDVEFGKFVVRDVIQTLQCRASGC